jgi:hypothetical protein
MRDSTPDDLNTMHQQPNPAAPSPNPESPIDRIDSQARSITLSTSFIPQ